MIFNFRNWFNGWFKNEGNKTVVKQKGNQNFYSEVDYNEKYLIAEQKIITLEKEVLELKKKISEWNYHEYMFIRDSSDNWTGMKFESKLLEKGIDYQRKSDKVESNLISYYVNKKDWKSFIECVTKYEEETKNFFNS